MNTTYIYILRDPDTTLVRYVGQSIDPSRRLSQHIKKSDKSSFPVHLWIKELMLFGKEPILEIKEECPVNLGTQREGYWINFYKNEITNVIHNHAIGAGKRATRRIKEGSKSRNTDEHTDNLQTIAKTIVNPSEYKSSSAAVAKALAIVWQLRLIEQTNCTKTTARTHIYKAVK